MASSRHLGQMASSDSETTGRNSRSTEFLDPHRTRRRSTDRCSPGPPRLRRLPRRWRCPENSAATPYRQPHHEPGSCAYLRTPVRFISGGTTMSNVEPLPEETGESHESQASRDLIETLAIQLGRELQLNGKLDDISKE